MQVIGSTGEGLRLTAELATGLSGVGRAGEPGTWHPAPILVQSVMP